MLLRRSAFALSRCTAIASPVVRRGFVTTTICRDAKSNDSQASATPAEKPKQRMVPFEEVRSREDLLPPGAEPGTVPTDLEQATGLERLEILGKMQGIDIFDMKPLDASRRGTLDDPIMVKSFGEEQYCGCTGCPADSHVVKWITISRHRPVNRCTECGSAYKMNYVGPEHDPHSHTHNGKAPGDITTFADFVKPEYF